MATTCLPHPSVPGNAELDRLATEAAGPSAAEHFDAELVREFSARIGAGTLSPEGNAVPGTVLDPDPGRFVDLPVPGTERHARALEAGGRAIRRGAVAMVVLGGGMATRFGGVVKATAEVVDGLSFLELKLAQAAAADGTVPVAVMTGWATHEAIREHARDRGLAEPLLFMQDFSLRLRPDGGLFRTKDGAVSPYTTGHGELPAALGRSGMLARLRRQGVRVLMVSNVDNLFATPDPAVIGTHLLSGRGLSVEVVCDHEGSGAVVARHAGRMRLFDGSELPGGRGPTRNPALNTNTFIVDLDALEHPLGLDWLYFRKEVEGRPAVQMERPLHHLTGTVETSFVRVPWHGPHSRFLPLKTRTDLERARPRIRESLPRLLPVG
ncbi:MAG TPA: UTP--glucose-1-phosphate uridylyltransferase [Actinospica sp.]|nr:UTP--glucose-1-phosphate uridylyltransferase [Actinospica sp.]